MALFLRGMIGSAFAILLFIALFFIPTWWITGSIHWLRGWELIIILSVLYFIATIWLLITDPDLLRERTSASGDQPLADKLAMAFFTLFLLGWLILVPIDVHALHLLPNLPEAFGYWSGITFIAGGSLVIWWTFRTNSFAAPIVKLQKEREQKVINTGPYAFVRHPMYSSLILFFIGIGLFLESTALALVAAPGCIIAFLPRMLVEEATLKKGLEGYADYMSQVRWRVLPKIF